MRTRLVWKITIVVGIAILGLAVWKILSSAFERVEARNLTGVVLVDDTDPEKQRPLADVRIEAADGVSAVTDASGLFRLKLPPSSVLNGVSLLLRHSDYTSLDRSLPVDGRLYVLRMKPAATGAVSSAPEASVSDVRVRYTENARTSSDTGSALKSFDVVNTGNVPCNGHPPCSPDGKWKAAVGGASLDAGEDNEFREARVSCIAGPCPFSKIEKDEFSRGGRTIGVTVLGWSDTVSYVLEAEVTRTTMSDLIRLSYPIIFGSGMNFSLPPDGEGPSIEATISGMEMVYPLGPDLRISWANCSMQAGKDQTKTYRCDLKPGYRFR